MQRTGQLDKGQGHLKRARAHCQQSAKRALPWYGPSCNSGYTLRKLIIPQKLSKSRQIALREIDQLRNVGKWRLRL